MGARRSCDPGLSPRRDLKRIPPPSAAALAGAQYYWIRHVHPVAILGFIAVLEGTPPDVEFFENLADRIGLPRQAFSNFCCTADSIRNIATTWITPSTPCR